MDFLQLVKTRQSVRRFASRPVAAAHLMQCLEAARLAPSASNSQPWTFVVIDDPNIKDQLAKTTYSSMMKFNRFTEQAPVLVALVLERPRLITQIAGFLKKTAFPQIDCGIAAQHFCLQAESLGLGTCMIGWFNQNEARRILQVPPARKIGLLIAVGYPETAYRLREKQRKSPEQVFRWNSYTQTGTASIKNRGE